MEQEVNNVLSISVEINLVLWNKWHFMANREVITFFHPERFHLYRISTFSQPFINPSNPMHSSSPIYRQYFDQDQWLLWTRFWAQAIDSRIFLADYIYM